jgi:hypothetical protein
MSMQLLIAAGIFAAIAIFAGDGLRSFAARRRLKPPHASLILLFRVWFALLALATAWILLRHPHSGR